MAGALNRNPKKRKIKQEKSDEVRIPGKRGRKQTLVYQFTMRPDGKAVCNICQKVLGNKSNAIVHTRSHTGEKPYRCFVCGAGFTTKPNLHRHEDTHLGLKKYSCPECNKKFSEKKSIKIHMLSHTGERPHKCDLCEASFRQLGTLISHRHIHTGWKGHICEECGKSFRQKGQLLTHMVRHEGSRKFFCDECNLAYFTNRDLNRHKLNLHNNSKIYICPVCKTKCDDLQSFYIHKKMHTKKSLPQKKAEIAPKIEKKDTTWPPDAEEDSCIIYLNAEDLEKQVRDQDGSLLCVEHVDGTLVTMDQTVAAQGCSNQVIIPMSIMAEGHDIEIVYEDMENVRKIMEGT